MKEVKTGRVEQKFEIVRARLIEKKYKLIQVTCAPSHRANKIKTLKDYNKGILAQYKHKTAT